VTKGKLDHLERLAGVEAPLIVFARRVPDELGGWWRIGRGVTTDKEQSALYAKGRTAPGPIVTHAQDAHETAHGMRRYGGCAIDFVAMNDDGQPDWTPARYLALGAFARSLGFEWGGDFKDPHTGKPMADLGHVQMSAWKTIPLPQNTV
jgi:hypothetical protein